jgi:hypothetical protein
MWREEWVTAFVYKEKGDYESAKRHYDKTWNISRKLLGKQHPLIIKSYKGLSSVNSAINNKNWLY